MPHCICKGTHIQASILPCGPDSISTHSYYIRKSAAGWICPFQSTQSAQIQHASSCAITHVQGTIVSFCTRMQKEKHALHKTDLGPFPSCLGWSLLSGWSLIPRNTKIQHTKLIPWSFTSNCMYLVDTRTHTHIYKGVCIHTMHSILLQPVNAFSLTQVLKVRSLTNFRFPNHCSNIYFSIQITNKPETTVMVSGLFH